jgi:hypothetical protein
MTWNVSFGFCALTQLPRNSEPLDAQPVRATVLSRQMEMIRRIKAFISLSRGCFQTFVVALRAQDCLMPK